MKGHHLVEQLITGDAQILADSVEVGVLCLRRDRKDGMDHETCFGTKN